MLNGPSGARRKVESDFLHRAKSLSGLVLGSRIRAGPRVRDDGLRLGDLANPDWWAALQESPQRTRGVSPRTLFFLLSLAWSPGTLPNQFQRDNWDTSRTLAWPSCPTRNRICSISTSSGAWASTQALLRPIEAACIIELTGQSQKSGVNFTSYIGASSRGSQP